MFITITDLINLE